MNATHHIVCPHCHTTNRVAAQTVGESLVCGQCKHALFDAQPLELDESSFNRHVGRNQIPVVVDFWAPWCGPCKMMAPAYQQAAALLEPRVRLAKLNTEAHSPLAQQFGIRSIPTLVLFQSGKEVARQSGAMGSEQIVRWVQSNIS
jgi:thioredoxin 2